MPWASSCSPTTVRCARPRASGDPLTGHRTGRAGAHLVRPPSLLDPCGVDGDEEQHHASVAVRAGARSGGARQSGPDHVGRTWWRIGFCASEVHVGEADLLSAEEALVSGTHRARRSEFATGRWCARHALDQVGAPQDLPLLADGRGAPRWPAGFVGSITHTPGWTGAVAAHAGRRRGIRSVGLDAETAAPLPPGVLDVIATRREQDEHERLVTLDPATPWDTVLFTAKEAT
ncbi:MAG TPA: hypothetical protein VLQ78_02175, partial [Ornithinibacter sp.]|nr:hypothetical protein [Ornithinibacter sp.]